MFTVACQATGNEAESILGEPKLPSFLKPFVLRQRRQRREEKRGRQRAGINGWMADKPLLIQQPGIAIEEKNTRANHPPSHTIMHPSICSSESQPTAINTTRPTLIKQYGTAAADLIAADDEDENEKKKKIASRRKKRLKIIGAIALFGVILSFVSSQER